MVSSAPDPIIGEEGVCVWPASADAGHLDQMFHPEEVKT